MKIRNGFVSNSSSSSFILMFKDIPTTLDELKKIMFSEFQLECDFVSNYDDEVYPLGMIAKDLLHEIQNSIVYDVDSLKNLFEEEFSCISKYTIDDLEGIFKDSEYNKEYKDLKDKVYAIENDSDKKSSELYRQQRAKEIDQDIFRSKYTNLNELRREKLQDISDKIYNYIEEIFKSKYQGYKFLEVEYADDTSFGTFMEHGGILDKMQLIRISHH